MSQSLKTITCLFYTKAGGLAIHLKDAPLQASYTDGYIPPGMMHAIQMLGMTPQTRTFTRTTLASESLPVYEEV